jgi:hypothetical protein
MFATHWCGPGGAGPTLNNLDNACQAHDFCYDAHGLSVFSNLNPFLSFQKYQALQQCNQQLCDAAHGAARNDTGSLRVELYFTLVPIGSCRVE